MVAAVNADRSLIPHAIDEALRWEGPVLVVETDHLKSGWIRRNGVPASDQATVVMYSMVWHLLPKADRQREIERGGDVGWRRRQLQRNGSRSAVFPIDGRAARIIRSEF